MKKYIKAIYIFYKSNLYIDLYIIKFPYNLLFLGKQKYRVVISKVTILKVYNFKNTCHSDKYIIDLIF